MKLSRKFYDRGAVDVAKDLLGKVLCRRMRKRILKGMIVETEAYVGPEDKASHSYGGKITERNRVMFGPPGHAYVYQIYGMYFCLNVVTHRSRPEAVLIRALHPLEGIDVMMKFRKTKLKNLTNGPGKLCQAMGIDKSLNGADLLGNEIWIEDDENIKKEFEFVSTARIGIDYAEEYRDIPWRFYIKNDPYVSKR